MPCPVLHDKLAAGADAVIVVNRIKPHTQVGTAAFLDEQPFQSGLFKMLVIGLGNNDQAVELHAGNYPKRNAMRVHTRVLITWSLVDTVGVCHVAGHGLRAVGGAAGTARQGCVS